MGLANKKSRLRNELKNGPFSTPGAFVSIIIAYQPIGAITYQSIIELIKAHPELAYQQQRNPRHLSSSGPADSRNNARWYRAAYSSRYLHRLALLGRLCNFTSRKPLSAKVKK
jgi:hypothetical protein